MPKLTQHQRIVAIMCIEKDKKWWKAHDIMNASTGLDNSLFVGYETTARLSEMIQDYPQMFDIKREGKFRLVRMKFDSGREWFPSVPRHIQDVIRRYYRRPGDERD